MKLIKKIILIFIIFISTLFLIHFHQGIIEEQNFLSALKEDNGKYLEDEVVVEVDSIQEAYHLEVSLDAKMLSYSEYKFAVFKLNNNRTILDLVKELNNDDLVNRITPNYTVKSFFTTTDPYSSSQTYLDQINLKSTTWSATKGEGILVAVIDTGVKTGHTDLKNQFSSLSYNASTKQVGLSYVNDLEGHGTAVSGIIAALQNRTGITGIAPLSKILAIKCDYTNESFTSSDLIEGIYYAANNGAHIINMSWGVESTINPYKTALQYAADRGVILVAAAGNSSSRLTMYPAADKNVISVGALNEDATDLASFSNYGQHVDIVAPGKALTTSYNGSYSYYTGTSFASPMIAGVISLYLSKNKTATVDEVKDMLLSTAKDIGNTGRDIKFGYGVVDADKFINASKVVITYNYMHEGIADSFQKTMKSASMKFTPLPYIEGYTFAGWFYDPEYTQEFILNNHIINNSLTLYAKWEQGYKINHYSEFLISSSLSTIILDAYIGSSSHVLMPNNITKIASYAFYTLPDLKYVSISSSVIGIDANAFRYNQYLVSVTIPQSVNVIADNAFISNGSLVIRAEVLSKPTNWSSGFNPDNKQVIYNYLSFNYSVKFYDDKGTTLLETTYVKYGSPAQASIEPQKTSNAQYTYIFKSWDKDTSYITANLIVKAVFNNILNTYTVTFYDSDGITLLGSTTVEYGHSAQSPVVDDKVEGIYVYSFNGWDKNITNVTSDIITKAVYTVSFIKYSVKFYDSDGLTLLQESFVEHGANAIGPIVPDRFIDLQYTDKFRGWDKDLSNITEETIVKAIYTRIVNKYTVVFVDEDNLTVLNSEIVEYGQSASMPTEPTKERTDQYTYKFSHWEGDFSFVTSNLTIKAVWIKTVNQYNVTFYDQDGITLLKEVTVFYGETATIGFIPTKEKTPQYTYTFVGWSQDISFVKKDMIVIAVFEATINKYQVVFMSEDNVVLDQITVEYGSPAFTSIIPQKERTPQYTYTFYRWDKNLSIITDNTITKPLFNATINTYQVTVIIDGIISVQTVEYGKDAYLPVAFEKEGYNFIGYDHDGKFITSNITINALYEIKTYTVEFVADGLMVTKITVAHGGSITEIPNVPLKVSYIGLWEYEDFENITSDLTVNAVYGNIVYTLTFKVEGMNDITRKVIEGQTLIDVPEVPQKTGYNAFWDKNDFSNITSDSIINAIYTPIIYQVKFYNYDSTLLTVLDVEYGKSVSINLTPVKPSSKELDFTFSGWDQDLEVITANTDVYALYQETIRIYTVIFKDFDGTLIKEIKVPYGEKIDPPFVEKEDYKLSGWYNDNVKYNMENPVETDLILIAKWRKTLGCLNGLTNVSFAYLGSFSFLLFFFRRRKLV